MIDWIDSIDKQIFLYFNGKHSDLSDSIWYFITSIPSWIPLYILLIILVFSKYKKDGIWLVGGILLTILICDQFTFSFMKPVFARPRPCHSPEIGHLVHVVKKCGGQYGFASGHASNSFGIAMYIWMTFRNIWPSFKVIFIWAAVVAFSRIMVGVHYPGDILTGAVLGIIFGYLVFRLTTWLYFKKNNTELIRN
jgi:undecaprenyl-diphosphatase